MPIKIPVGKNAFVVVHRSERRTLQNYSKSSRVWRATEWYREKGSDSWAVWRQGLFSSEIEYAMRKIARYDIVEQRWIDVWAAAAPGDAE
jgi:hypothetical protein